MPSWYWRGLKHLQSYDTSWSQHSSIQRHKRNLFFPFNPSQSFGCNSLSQESLQIHSLFSYRKQNITYFLFFSSYFYSRCVFVYVRMCSQTAWSPDTVRDKVIWSQLSHTSPGADSNLIPNRNLIVVLAGTRQNGARLPIHGRPEGTAGSGWLQVGCHRLFRHLVWSLQDDCPTDWRNGKQHVRGRVLEGERSVNPFIP